jgi:glycine/D-amino acid oxidase-like deaminating enzyme
VCTADGRPLIGGCAIDGLHLHTGDNGWGIEGGPEAGRRLAGIVAGVLADDETNPYRLDRAGVAAGAPRLVTY